MEDKVFAGREQPVKASERRGLCRPVALVLERQLFFGFSEKIIFDNPLFAVGKKIFFFQRKIFAIN
jgi:hypothetical protein